MPKVGDTVKIIRKPEARWKLLRGEEWRYGHLVKVVATREDSKILVRTSSGRMSILKPGDWEE
jgi:hypothetical protein